MSRRPLQDPFFSLIVNLTVPFEINVEEDHNNMIYQLAEKLPPQSLESVLFTVKALEMACFLTNLSDQTLVSQALKELSKG